MGCRLLIDATCSYLISRVYGQLLHLYRMQILSIKEIGDLLERVIVRPLIPFILLSIYSEVPCNFLNEVNSC